jgi:hypothetical protein
LPVACDVSSMSIYASTNKKGPLDATADTVTLTVYKNNSPTDMTCSASSTTNIHEVVSNMCTPGPVSFAVGDTLGLQWTHTNPSGSLFTQYGAGFRCQ